MPWGCLRFVAVVFPDHTHLLFIIEVRKTAKITKSSRPTTGGSTQFDGVKTNFLN